MTAALMLLTGMLPGKFRGFLDLPHSEYATYCTPFIPRQT